MARLNGRTQKIWHDSQLVDWQDATIHVMSHVVHYGSGVFEGIRCYETPSGGAIFRLREHLRRLVDSCRIYRMPVRYSIDELMQASVDTVSANEMRHCYLRPLAIRTGEQNGLPGRLPTPRERRPRSRRRRQPNRPRSQQRCEDPVRSH